MFRNNSTWKQLNQLEENKLAVDSLKEKHKEFIENNKIILKSQQRFRSKKHNGFTEEVNKIALSDKRIITDKKRIK